jgi:hypothetical protein
MFSSFRPGTTNIAWTKRNGGKNEKGMGFFDANDVSRVAFDACGICACG